MKKFMSLLSTVVMMITILTGCRAFGNPDFSLSQTNLTMTVGDKTTVSVSTDGAGTPKLNWTTDNSEIAIVDNGVVTAKGVGSTVIKAKDEYGTEKYCSVTVNGKEVMTISLNTGTTTLKVGKNIELIPSFSPADASDTRVTWSSDNSSIATVNSQGYVTGVSAGTTNIICRAANGVEASCTVTVTEEKKSSSSSSSSGKTASDNAVIDNDININIFGGHLNPSYRPVESDFVFPYSSVRKLTTGEINARLSSMGGYPVSNSFAQDAINEIYARNGYPFKSANLRRYYESKPWYYANPSFNVYSDCNSIELYNINLLSNWQ